MSDTLTPAQKRTATRRVNKAKREATRLRLEAEQAEKRQAAQMLADLMPPPTEAEKAANADILRRLQEMADLLERQNLDPAVQLSIQASKRQGPLVEHFMELGRRFGHQLRNPEPQPNKPGLHAIQGGG